MASCWRFLPFVLSQLCAKNQPRSCLRGRREPGSWGTQAQAGYGAVATLKEGLRTSEDCPAAWRLAVGHVSHAKPLAASSLFTYSTFNTTKLFPSSVRT